MKTSNLLFNEKKGQIESKQLNNSACSLPHKCVYRTKQNKKNSENNTRKLHSTKKNIKIQSLLLAYYLRQLLYTMKYMHILNICFLNLFGFN